MPQTEHSGSDTPGQTQEGADPHHDSHYQHVQVVACTFLGGFSVGHGELVSCTFSLCSFLLTMTEVICWSMKRSTVSRRAGKAASR